MTTACSSSQQSCAVLHNNIGALLYKRGEHEDAKKHYQLAADEISGENDDSNAASGLAWFYRKLAAEQKRGYTTENVDDCATKPRRGLLRRNSSTGTMKLPCCHELTPLGLEYYHEPWTVTCTEDVVTASCLNVALAKYEDAVSNDQVEQLVEDLGPQNRGAKSSFLNAAYASNMGVLLFRLGKSKEALACFDQAHDAIRDVPIPPQQEAELSYLKSLILLNRSRASVRLNDTTTASNLVSDIEELESSIQKKKPLGGCKSSPSALQLQARIRWMSVVATRYITGMIYQRQEELTKALESYKMFVNDARHELGHAHLHVASVLYLKGMILFDQRKLHHAMLAQLACKQIREQHAHADKRELAQVMYSVGRTLHDREEYRDALQMYQETLTLQRQIMTSTTCIDVVTTLCNVARVHHVVGDIDACLKVNQEIVEMARRLARGKKHPFVADRLQVLGNVLVEAGRLSEAMDVYATAARSGASNSDNEHVRNSRYDIDSRWASTLAKAGLQHPSAATA